MDKYLLAGGSSRTTKSYQPDALLTILNRMRNPHHRAGIASGLQHLFLMAACTA